MNEVERWERGLELARKGIGLENRGPLLVARGVAMAVPAGVPGRNTGVGEQLAEFAVQVGLSRRRLEPLRRLGLWWWSTPFESLHPHGRVLSAEVYLGLIGVHPGGVTEAWTFLQGVVAEEPPNRPGWWTADAVLARVPRPPASQRPRPPIRVLTGDRDTAQSESEDLGTALHKEAAKKARRPAPERHTALLDEDPNPLSRAYRHLDALEREVSDPAIECADSSRGTILQKVAFLRSLMTATMGSPPAQLANRSSTSAEIVTNAH